MRTRFPARIATGLVVVTALVAPLRADLKYTMRLEAHASSVASTPPANPLLAVIGSLVTSTLVPAGGVEMVVTVGPQGTRVDYPRGYTVIPIGGATIMLPDGSMTVLDPASRTFWKMEKLDLASLDLAPTTTVKRLGVFATITGVRAEQATVQIRMRLPLPSDAGMPQGMPTELVLNGEAWFSAEHARYAKMAAGAIGGNVFGVEALAAEGFLMRSILRGELLGDREIESVVIAVEETAVPPDLFLVPADYTQTQPPAVPLQMPK